MDKQPTPSREASIASADPPHARWERRMQDCKSEEERLDREYLLDKQRRDEELERYEIKKLEYAIAEGKLATNMQEADLERPVSRSKGKQVARYEPINS